MCRVSSHSPKVTPTIWYHNATHNNRMSIAVTRTFDGENH